MGEQSPSERPYLYPDSRSLTRARSLVRGRHLDVLSAFRPCGREALSCGFASPEGRNPYHRLLAHPMKKIEPDKRRSHARPVSLTLPSRKPMRILIAAIPPVRPLDVVGPVEVFGDANRMRGGDPVYSVEIVASGEEKLMDLRTSRCQCSRYDTYREAAPRAHSLRSEFGAHRKVLIMATQLLGQELSNREFFIQRWEQEYPAFMRVFKALSANRLDYRPHPRSRSAEELVALLVSAQQSCIQLCKSRKSFFTAVCAGRTQRVSAIWTR